MSVDITRGNGQVPANSSSHKSHYVSSVAERTGGGNIWLYPPEMEGDLKGVGLPEKFVAETLACAWEFTRCVIPSFINWDRYIAYTRLIALSTVAEYGGDYMDVIVSDTMLGYDINKLLNELFKGAPFHDDMAREFRSNLLFTADKSCQRRNSELFRRYVNSLARSPKTWFRLRDTDGLARFTIAAALTCNGILDMWFAEEELQIFGELSLAMYDSVAYYKHRAEGETHNAFAYAGFEAREETYRRSREVLWALDASKSRDPSFQQAINFSRFLGGPIHLMMRRYRFVDDNLTLGRPENEQVVADAREHVKLWNRLDAGAELGQDDRLAIALKRKDELLFSGQAELLKDGANGHCNNCKFRIVYGVTSPGTFGGVELCADCRVIWQKYLEDLPARATKVFPFLRGALLDEEARNA